MSSAKPTGGKAFPSTGPVVNSGMDLRDYFAAHAPFTMNDAFTAHLTIAGEKPTGKEIHEMLAAMRYGYADAMLAARQENKP